MFVQTYIPLELVNYVFIAVIGLEFQIYSLQRETSNRPEELFFGQGPLSLNFVYFLLGNQWNFLKYVPFSKNDKIKIFFFKIKPATSWEISDEGQCPSLAPRERAHITSSTQGQFWTHPHPRVLNIIMALDPPQHPP